MRVAYHPLAAAEVSEIYSYYQNNGGCQLAERFLAALLDRVAMALANPRGFPLLRDPVRRANLVGFPYHFLYVPRPWGLKVLVVRHHRRDPGLGLTRR
jgi:plasmid stabilization system protein ParE